ncbi:TPA: hypothetical protein DEG21_01640 [Patescibacteria group bacterium]|nr:hypothetical protein [Candidatus Gracilibacteria bacterium]HBY74591.1 hypothetical protein [Candidatus Gracilibacteria bacterium]
MNLEKDFKINFRILVPLAISSFLDASIRNESIMLMLAIFFIEFGLFWFYNKKDFKFKKYLFVF